MTDIEKLKQEAEMKRNKAAEEIFLEIGISQAKARVIADRLITATIAQIALQAAEKEANDPFLIKALKIVNELTPEELESKMKDHGMVAERRVNANPAPIADDVWIKWEGGECPVNLKDKVVVKWRDGKISSEPYFAQSYLWQHGNDEHDDIIAYRIISPAADRVGEP